MSRHDPRRLSRRQFLGQASCAAVGSAAFFSTLFNLRMASTVAAASDPYAVDDYKALVCLFLGGGNDSFNMVVPLQTDAYADYAAIRGDLALPREELLPLSVSNGAPALGLHPGMPEVQQLYADGRLALLANVGTLVEPVTKAAYLNGNARLPLGLFSHSDQIMHWQTSLPDQRGATGWAGRVADLLHTANQDSAVSMNISLAGNSLWQTGTDVTALAVDAIDGVQGINGYGDTASLFNRIKTGAVNSLLDQHYQQIFAQGYLHEVRQSIEAGEAFRTALATAPTLTTVFPEDPIAQSFRMIAEIIGARPAFGAKRQTFMVFFGGWDHHDEVLNSQAEMLPVVSRALGTFNTALDELGMADAVTTFTASDFARTLTSNGEGSDHAWGSHQLVTGGAVKGGQLYGTWPELHADNALDVGRGRLIPTTSVDAYFAELALWFGVPPSQLELVFPNLHRFHDTTTAAAPLGMFRNATV